jgi:outer membrane protein assembly factor BamB
MRGRYALGAGVLLGVNLLLFTWNQAHAVVTAKTPLKAIAGSSSYILVGKVEKFFPEKPAMLVVAIEDIKGKAPFRQLPINCKVADEKAFKENKIEPLLKRLGPDMEIIIFLAPRDNGYITFAFTNGTWFQLEGTQVGKDQVVFNLHSAEPYFRKSFKGSTEELRKLLKEYIAGKAKLPPVDDKVEPGFGPEYMPKKGAANPAGVLRLTAGLAWWSGAPRQGSGTLFAVIPTIGLGAPLAILALLFPSLFGGVFVLFRQWLAFITLISLNSTLLFVQWAFADQLPRGSWWSTPAALWFLMTLFTFICSCWAWRRQLNALSDGDADAPPRTELAVLVFMTASCIVTTSVLWCITAQIRWSDVGWTLTVVMTLGILAGTLYRCWSALRKPALFGSMPMATEGVILGAMLLGHVAFVPAIFGGRINTAGSAEGKEQLGDVSAEIAPFKTKWVYTAPENYLGMFASAPVVDGDAVYASFSDALFRATLVRLDRHTGLQKWAFSGKKPSLRQMISTPCLADGKLYFGEGFHDDKNCHVFCIDAENGAEVWRFKTAGQTESSPTVVNGKVYIGAGNDGVYCLNAKDGSPLWRYWLIDLVGVDGSSALTKSADKKPLLRFGGGMLVVGNRLYAGTGVDRNEKIDKGETAVFCFDATTGMVIWKTPAPYPVWSTPVLKDGRLYVTSGNGDVFTDVPPPDKPGGAIQCLEADTGKILWSKTFANGIIEAPAVDAHRIYFGCRNGTLYCLARADGTLRWERYLDSPIIATPVLDSDPVYERTLSVFVTSTAGRICCLNPQTGDIVWNRTPEQPTAISTSPRLIVTRTPEGYRRQLYIGCGVGGGPRPDDLYDNRPVFYCLEDLVKVE